MRLTKSISFPLFCLFNTLLVTVFVISFLAPAHAEEFSPPPRFIKKTIVGKPVILTLPHNHCLLDEKNPSDKMLIEGVEISIKGANELLLTFAHCQELSDWRTGKQKYLNNFGNYQVSSSLKKTDMTGQEIATIKEICHIFKKQGNRLLENLQPEINRRIQDGFKDVQLNQMKNIGVVYQDPSVCLNASFQRMKTSEGSIKDQINMNAISILNGRLIFTYLFMPYGDKTAIDQLTTTMMKLNNINQKKNQKKAR